MSSESEAQVESRDECRRKNFEGIHRIWTILFTILPIIFIVIGSLHLLQCSAENYFPVFLLVAGLLGLLNPLLLHLDLRKKSEAVYICDMPSPDDCGYLIFKLLALLNWLMLFWLLISSYWIYSAYEPKDDAVCKVYLFAVWLVTPIYFGAIIVAITYSCCGLICCKLLDDIQ